MNLIPVFQYLCLRGRRFFQGGGMLRISDRNSEPNTSTPGL